MKQVKWTSIIFIFLILSLSNGQSSQASPNSTNPPEETHSKRRTASETPVNPPKTQTSVTKVNCRVKHQRGASSSRSRRTRKSQNGNWKYSNSHGRQKCNHSQHRDRQRNVSVNERRNHYLRGLPAYTDTVARSKSRVICHYCKRPSDIRPRCYKYLEDLCFRPRSYLKGGVC